MVTVNDKKVPLMGTGLWNKVATNLDGFTSALSGIHHGLGWSHHTDYVAACPDCWENNNKVPHVFHCRIHNPILFQPRTSGSVIQSEIFKSTKTFISCHGDHTVKRCGQVRPSEMRQIGLHCINSGSQFKVSIFVCVLLAVELFLCKEEFRGIEFEAFINDMMIMSSEYIIEGLVVKLKKKRTGSTEEQAGTLLLSLAMENI
jgi:hypothetical protein